MNYQIVDLSVCLINERRSGIKDQPKDVLTEKSMHEAKGDCGTGWHYLKSFFIYTEDQLINVE